MDFLLSITDRFGTIDKDKATGAGYRVMEGDAWLEQEAHILIPAALENQISGDNVDRIHSAVRIVAEGANGPTTPDADEVLKRRGIFVIPDFLANAGGVTCSYFEQVQCNSNFFWPKNEVLERVDQKMTSAFHAVARHACKLIFCKPQVFIVFLCKASVRKSKYREDQKPSEARSELLLDDQHVEAKTFQIQH